jgi:dipeptidyl aminopeptidase/acylaminoacyl peptidase
VVILRRVAGLVAAVTTALPLAGCSSSSDDGLPDETAPGTTVVFETGVPGAGDACDGLWAVEVGGRRARLVVGPRGAEGAEEPAIPSFASNGSTLAFGLSREGYEFDVYALAAQSGRVSRIASRTGALFLREWSPATDELLTLRAGADEEGHELVVVRPNGETRVVDEDPPTVDYAWSPDGEKLAFSASDKERKREYLAVMDADGDERQEVAELGEDDGGWAFPSWSPDGRTIAYFRDGDLWTVGVNGGDPQRLAAREASEERGVFWLPSGRELLLAREPPQRPDEGFIKDVVRVDLGSGAVTPQLQGVVPVGLSPRGDELLFLRPHRQVSVPGGFFAPEDMYSIRVRHVDGGAERTIGVMHESVLRHGSRPVWQPRAGEVAAATGAFRPRRAAYCARLLDAYRRRLSK